MNKSAVALAADSAVTISGRHGVKTYDSMNKLFELIRGSNVGIMIYSNAEINGVPWESIIKAYRDDNRDFRAPHVEDYFDHFCSFLATDVSMLRPSDELFGVSEVVLSNLAPVFTYVTDNVERYVRKNGTVVKSTLRDVVDEALVEFEQDLARAKDAPWANELSESKLKKSYGTLAEKIVSELFKAIPISATTRRKIISLSLAAMRKCVSEPIETGLVFAGFGESDAFPTMISSLVRGRHSGVLRAAHTKGMKITVAEPGHLETFAQDEQAWGWLSGVTGQVRERVVRHWTEWVDSVGDSVVERLAKELPTLDEDTLKKVAASVHGLTEERLFEFLDDMNELHLRRDIEPMIRSISMLPKGELGVLAESLVNLTSLKQRVSIFDVNTVGGPIDVAIISIGDGFVWLNRKHYFSPALNPAWHLTHGVTILENPRRGT